MLNLVQTRWTCQVKSFCGNYNPESRYRKVTEGIQKRLLRFVVEM